MSRVTMFVHNDAVYDSRVRKEAASLAAAGHEVTLITTRRSRAAEAALPGHDGSFAVLPVVDRRPWRHNWPTLRERPWKLIRRELGDVIRGPRSRRRGESRVTAAARAAALFPWVALRAVREQVPVTGRSVGLGKRSGIAWLAHWHDIEHGWAVDAGLAAPRSDVYHGHDLDGLRAAIAAASRDGGAIVYDCHDLMLKGTGAEGRPAWARAWMDRRQREWIGQADRAVTVSVPLADELDRLGMPEAVIVRNCSPQWEPRPGDGDLLRAAAGVARGAPLVMYHGGLSPQRGIEQLLACAESPGFEDVEMVFMGYGSLRTLVGEAASRNPRVHLLDPVPPGDLVPWLSGADVAAIVYQPNPNHEGALPNKLFETMMAGVPALVSDFPAMRHVVLDDPLGRLGRVCDPTDVQSVAAGLLDLLAETRRDPTLSARCHQAACERWNWEHEAQVLLDLYRDLGGRAAAAHSSAT
jgi:glycosyltransferase involved in cell wall biosynthesis